MVLRRFRNLTQCLGLILAFWGCHEAKAKPVMMIQLRAPPAMTTLESTKILQSYDVDLEGLPTDRRATNYNLNFLLNYNITSPTFDTKQDFDSNEKLGQKFRSASIDANWGRYAFVTDRVPTKNQNENGNDKHLLSKRIKQKKLDSALSRKRSSRNIMEGFNNLGPSEKNRFELYPRIQDAKQGTKTSVIHSEVENGEFNQANLVDTDINYQEESTEIVSHFVAEPTDYVYSSQRNGFVPVSGPFGNSGYYGQSRMYRHNSQTTAEYPPVTRASQPRVETRSYYSSGRDILGSGNFEILRGGTFSDNDELLYPQQQNNDMLFERDVPYRSPILGFQGFNHFSSPLHSSLSNVVHVATSPPLMNPGRGSHFISTSAILEAVP